MAHSFQHVHLRGDDPAGSAQWYVDIFEAKPLGERTAGGSRSASVQLGGVTITISSPRPQEVLRQGDANPCYGLDHIAFSTDDLERDLKRLEERRTRILQKMEVPVAKIAFIEGPDKVRIELMQLQRAG